jgi:TP901 family phage tail tape measure protein
MDKNMNVTVALTGVDKLNPKLKEAIGRVSEITARAKQATATLKAIAISQNQMRSIDQARDKMRSLGNQIKVAEQNARAVAERMKIGAATQTDLDKATAAVKRLETEYDRLGRTALDTRSKLNAKGLTGPIDAQRARLQAEQASAMAALQRQERLQAAQTRAEGMRSRAGTMASVGVSMMAPGYMITRGLGTATGEASAYHAELRQIALTADMTDARMKALGSTIVRTSADVFQSTESLTSGVGFLIAAGMNEQLAERSIATIGRVSTAYKADILEIAQSSFVLNDALGIAPEKLQGAIAIMAKSGKEGNVELRDMAKILPVLGSGMVALKMQGNEAVATIGAALQIARKGAPTADIAANNMQNFLTKVMSPETLKKANEKFGLDLYGVITRAQASGKNPVEAALDAISKVTKGGDQKLLGDLFQDMQVQSFLRPMLQNMDEYRRIKAEALAAAGGSMIDEDFARVAKDMDVSSRLLGNAWTNIKIMVGTALAPALAPVARLLASAATGLVNFAEKHPKLISLLAILAGILGVVLVAGGGIALMIAAVLVPMAALTVAAGALGIALTPVLLILAAIAAAVAGVVAVFIYWDEIVGYFRGKWEALKTELSTVGSFFMTVGRAILDGLIKPIMDGGVQVVRAIIGVVSKGVDAVKSFLGIRSPSRVFAEIGGHTTAGLALGINRGAPAAVDSVRRMAAGITVAGAATLSAGMAMAGPGPGAAPGAGAAGGFSIGQVTIVIDGASGDPQAIARAVEAQLRKMATQARTDAQSRFFDDQ